MCINIIPQMVSQFKTDILQIISFNSIRGENNPNFNKYYDSSCTHWNKYMAKSMPTGQKGIFPFTIDVRGWF